MRQLRWLLSIIVLLCMLRSGEGASPPKGKYVGEIYSVGLDSIIGVRGKINKKGKLVLFYIDHPCRKGKVRGRLDFTDPDHDFCAVGIATAVTGTGSCIKTRFLACGNIVDSASTQLVGDWLMPAIGDFGTFILQRR